MERKCDGMGCDAMCREASTDVPGLHYVDTRFLSKRLVDELFE